jgi:ATP-binding cassette subfamily B multidrug efflux pump
MTTGNAKVDGAALRRLLRGHARSHRRAIGAVVLLQTLQALALLYLPTLNAAIIDDGVVAGDTPRIFRLGGLMIGVTVLQGVATVLAVRLSTTVAMAVGGELREAVFRQVQRFSAYEIEGFGVPSLITRTGNDVQQVQMFMLSFLTLVVTAPVMAVGGVVLAATQDVPLSLLLLALLPVLTAVAAVLIRRMRPLSGRMQVRIDAVNRVLREQIAGMRVTRAFVKQDFERRRYDEANTELTEVSIGLGRVNTLLMPIVVNLVNVCGVVVVWIGAYRVGSGEMRIGTLTAFLTYLVMVQTAVLTAAFVAMGLARAEVGAARIEEVLRTEPRVRPPAAAVTVMERPGEVELRGVHFRYPGAEDEVLRGVDLVARPGTTTAIVGSTGSGKSTVIAMICRLFDATAGEVLVGGVDIRRLEPGLAAASIGLITQQPYLFTGTIATNLRYGRPDATDEDLWRALTTAQALDFVQRLDGGLHAVVGPGGRNLSGGQRQRIAIARAFVRRPQVYLFDDSFSALDYATDAALRQALAAETADATIVIVAQRVSTIVEADRVLVLHQGRVVAAGTHQELLVQSPVYQEIVRSQLGEEQPV